MLVLAHRGVGAGLLLGVLALNANFNTKSCRRRAKQLLGLCCRKWRRQNPRISSGKAGGGQL